LRAGNFIDVAADAAGVHCTTVHRWLRTGREQKKGRYRRFFDAVEKAQAEAEARDVALIAKAASEDSRAPSSEPREVASVPLGANYFFFALTGLKSNFPVLSS